MGYSEVIIRRVDNINGRDRDAPLPPRGPPASRPQRRAPAALARRLPPTQDCVGAEHAEGAPQAARHRAPRLAARAQTAQDEGQASQLRGWFTPRVTPRIGVYHWRGDHGTHPRRGRRLFARGRTTVLFTVDAQHQPGPAGPPAAARAPRAAPAHPSHPHAGMGLQHLYWCSYPADGGVGPARGGGAPDGVGSPRRAGCETSSRPDALRPPTSRRSCASAA